jgi:hypothetical protein
MPLIVSIDLVPGGEEFASREIGRLVLKRKGPIRDQDEVLGIPGVGDYDVLVRYETGEARTVEVAGRANDVERIKNPWFFLLNLLAAVDFDD